MSSPNVLHEIILALNTNKKKEKLGALENLIDLLSREEVINILHENTKSEGKSMNWDILFIRVHGAAISLIDDSNSKVRPMCEKHIQIIQNAVLQLIQKSVYQKCIQIDCNLIISSILEIFESELRIKYVGSIYLKIFTNNIISQRKNWCALKEEDWTGIKNLCKNQLSNPLQKAHHVIFLEILTDVIRYGSKGCQVSQNFLDLFEFIEQIFKFYKSSDSNFELELLRLTNTLCLQLAIEFRYKVCEFMENIFDTAIRFQDRKKPNKNVLVYHFLTTTLSIHNPNGIWGDGKFSYAHNMKNWKSQIKKIYFFCLDEIRLILKNPDNAKMEIDILDLFVDVSHLVSLCGLENFSEGYDFEVTFGEPGPFRKRKCSVETPTQNSNTSNSGKLKQIKLDGVSGNLLNDLQSSDGWFWLKYLEIVLQKYPLDLKNEYYQLIEILFLIICEKRNAQNTKAALRCLCSIIELENIYDVELSNEQAKLLNETWSKINMELLRSLHNEKYSETHSLLRSLINRSKILDPGPFIGLYCNKTLESSIDNFQTLCAICQNCILPDVVVNENRVKCNQENYDNVRAHLLHWILQWEVNYPSKELAKVLVALILKRFEEEIEHDISKDNILISRVNINDLCKIITNNYMTVGFKNLKFIDDCKGAENSFHIRFDYETKSKLFHLLEQRWKELEKVVNNEALSVDDQMKVLKDGLWFCELLSNLLSQFEFMNISGKDNKFLMNKLQSLLLSCTTKGLNLNQVKIFDLSPFSNLYNSHFHMNVQKKIRDRDSTNLNLFKHLFKVFADRNEFDGNKISGNDSQENENNINSNSRFSQLIKNPQSMFHIESLIQKEKLIIGAVELLCQYITVPGETDPNQYQSTLSVKIIDNLINDEYFNTSSNFHLQIVLRVIYNFTKFDGITVSVLNNILDLISSILKLTDFELLITVLQILKDLTNLVHRVGDMDTQSKFIKIMEELRTTIVIKKHCSVKAVSKFIECLAEISKVDIEGTWSVSESNETTFKIFEDIITFLSHPYHEVRLTSAQAVGFLFVCNKETKESTITWQKEMLRKVFDVLDDIERPKNKDSVLEYTNSVVSSISLIAWANIICLSTYWRKKGLFYLLHLAYARDFKNSEVEDIIKLICKELKISKVVDYIRASFMYLFNKWARKDLKMQDFPFYLLGYNTTDEFIQNNFPVLVRIYGELGNIDAIKMISAKLNKSFGEILRECHGILMSFILPCLSENTHSESVKTARKLEQLIHEEMPPKTAIHLLTESLDVVIFNMIRNMNDPAYLKTLTEYSGNLEDDSGIFTSSQIIKTLKNLSAIEGTSLLGKIAEEMPSIVQKILISLNGDVEQAVIYEDKILAFYKYIFFVSTISKETKKGKSYYGINTFIIRDVLYTLAGIIRKDEGETLTFMACKCYRQIAESYIPNFSKVFGEFLPVLTTSVTNIAPEKTLEVLNFLFRENYSKLQSDIVFLDPFPSDETFGEINRLIERKQTNVRSLKNYIKKFIRAGRRNNFGYRVEGLKNLQKMLSENKSELKDMYDNLKTLRGFSEDCKNSLLHQLICMLVELASDKNMIVRIEAAKCLGELGPSDLTTLVLRPENIFSSSKETDTGIHRLFKASINPLSDLVISDNYNVKLAASKALYAVLSTRQGKEIIKGNNEENFTHADHLTPFYSKTSDEVLRCQIQKNNFVTKVNRSQLWRPDCHEKWIVDLLIAILESLSDSKNVLNCFRELIQINWQFAEFIFPVVLDLIISLNENDCVEVISKNVNSFFEDHFDYKNKSPTFLNKASVKCMVGMVDYVRIQKNHEGFYEGSVLNVNYLHLAKAALYCSAFFTSIFYAELWFEEKRKSTYSFVDINMICELYPEEGFALTEILRECYSKIGNFDGIHGCGYMYILNTSAEIQHLKNWNLSVLHHDIQLSRGDESSESGLINSLEQSGMLYTLNNFTKRKNTGEIHSAQYKCAAQLLDWSLLDTYKTKNNLTVESFDKCYYFALKAFHDEDDATFQNETYKARKSILSELSNCSLESTKNLYLPLSELQCLKELEEFASVVRNSNEIELANLDRKWSEQDNIKCNDFRLIKSILTNRIIMLRDRMERSENSEIRKTLRKMLSEMNYKLTVAARKEKKYETAIRALDYLNDSNHVTEEIMGKFKIEKARLLWERGDKEIGRFLLNHFLKTNEVTGELKAKSLRIYGDWMAETKSENTVEIIEKYYLKSIEQSKDSTNKIDTFASLAKFAHSNYEQLNEYLSSPLFKIKESFVSNQQHLAAGLFQDLKQKDKKRTREKIIAYELATKQKAIDENEIKNNKAERDSYLNLALKYYLLSLKEGEKYNLLVFRLVSLWLSNAGNPGIIQQLQDLPQIPTYKFLCLLPQLVPRMADFLSITILVERILQQHPHHTLPLLFALNNAYEDIKYNNINPTPTPTPRILAAKTMLDKYQNNKDLELSIVEMRRVTKALIELANYKPQEKGKVGCPIEFPKDLTVKDISSLRHISVPTLDVPVEKNCVYNDIIGIHKFEQHYYLVGGANAPKRITCVGTDGISRPLLVKGADDLRQDAVMQQVFTIMNSLLYQNADTNKRKLCIRTYKVIPLSHRSGVIEWCGNTQTLSSYLTGPDGRSGAHKKFYPNDYSSNECRSLLIQKLGKQQVTNEEKLKVFTEICERIHPVFHNFFIERFPAAGVWFERRLTYIHSVATSSMIGYILGIGDRHVKNILIDNDTAEVIHIDLGIAFEQGKTLPHPETVPFRLTRDIVDGMGLSGIEGDFRISCVKTMEVLRNNQDTILTLLEVLLYDPLYTWTITPEKAYSMQGHAETSSTTSQNGPSPDLERNMLAERALLRLKQKLQGAEAGCVSTNVEAQVIYLIQQARDPNNLCKLFHGWQAYL